jgi:hypothetical protein
MTQSDTASRFRKGGLTRSLTATATATAAGAAALLTANAAIILTDNVNLTADLDNPADQFQNTFVTSSPSTGFQLYTGFDGKSGQQYAGVNTISSQLVRDSPSGNSLLQMGTGISVDAGSSFTSGGQNIANPSLASGWLTRGSSGYFGFSINPSGSLPLYGWGELVRSATGTDTITLTRYAYEDSGAAILTGAVTAVPEPESYAVLGGTGLLVMAGIRRWRQRATPAGA